MKNRIIKNIVRFCLIGFGILLYSNTWAQHHNCTEECYAEPDSVIQIVTTLPFAEEEQKVTVGVKNGFILYEGDIILGTYEDVVEKGVARNSQFWPNKTLYYTIGPGFSAGEITKINRAIDTLELYTNLDLVVRTTQADYILVDTSFCCCSSAVGMSGGMQRIELASGCSFGSTMHEFLHAAGIWHEHTICQSTKN